MDLRSFPFLPVNDHQMIAFKAGLAAIGVIVLTLRAIPKLAARPRALRALDGALALLGILGFAAFFNLFKLHFGGVFVHGWDLWHYAVGAKYLPELGYTHLYECSAVADLEDGYFRPGQLRKIRDLHDNRLRWERAQDLPAAECKARFTPDRWRDFTFDTSWYRYRNGPERWAEMQGDHGFNGTPVWAILGRFVTARPMTDGGALRLAMIDPLPLLGMWIAIARAFGWRHTCLALLTWVTNFPARYFWTGGSLLRMDWLAAAGFGLAWLKRGRYASGGAALMASALLRIFPGTLLLALFALVGLRLAAARSLSLTPAERRTLLGAAGAFLVLVPLSVVVCGRGPRIYLEFARNSAKHVDTPLTNHVGLKTLVAYGEATRAATLKEPFAEEPFARWKSAQREAKRTRRPVFFGIALLFCAAVGMPLATLRKRPEIERLWVSAALGVLLIPVLFELTSYYFAILPLAGLLWLISPWAGIAGVVWSLLTCAAYWRSGWDDDQHAFVSAVTLALVLVVSFAIRRASAKGIEAPA